MRLGDIKMQNTEITLRDLKTNIMDEKTKRNLQIYLDKLGLDKPTDLKPVKSPKTYRVLSQEHDLSIKRLLEIVNKYKNLYGGNRK